MLANNILGICLDLQSTKHSGLYSVIKGRAIILGTSKLQVTLTFEAVSFQQKKLWEGASLVSIHGALGFLNTLLNYITSSYNKSFERPNAGMGQLVPESFADP